MTGWHQFRMDDWRFPLMEQALAGYPDNISAVFTDSNPLFSLFFKVFRSFLPPHFQFVGLWYLLVLFLNYLVLYRTLRLFSASRPLCLLGAALISLFPPLFSRDGHDTLTAHFLVTFLLYFVFKDEKRYTYPAIAAICALTVSIHFYFLLFGLLATPTKVFYEHGFNRRSVCATLIWSGVNLLSTLAMMTLLGYWGYKGAVDGFGYYSMNLNALINPLELSRLLPALPLGPDGQYEGFQYLGLGWMLFLIWSLFTPGHALTRCQFWSLLLCFFLPLALFSLSNRIYWGNMLLFHYPLPRFVQYVGNTLHASGRFFWGISYCLMLLACKKFFGGAGRNITILALTVGIGLQMYDVRFYHPVEFTSFPASNLEAVVKGQGNLPTHINTSLLFPSDYQSSAFYVDLMYLSDRRVPVTGLYTARRKKNAPLLTCEESLAQGGLCLISHRNLLALPPGVFLTDTPSYLVASADFLPGSKPISSMKQEITFSGAELPFFPENAWLSGETIRSRGRTGYISYGPYAAVSQGTYLITVKYAAAAGSELVFDVFSRKAPSLHAQYQPSPAQTVFQFRVELDRAVPDLEIRTFLQGKGSLAVYGVTIKKES